jgi:histidyl-tRNA synthetase
MERRQFRAPRGIRDVLPEEIPAWRFLEETARRLAELRGYREIRPALLEEADLFTRSVGEVTDIVQKEMFTLQKEGGALALRPEGTAGIVRAYLEAGYASTAPVQRLFHVGPMFRYERPQKGRERMFTQFDVEALGSLDPRLDAEVIHLAASFFEALGFQEVWVHISTMGDGDDRDRWRDAVREYLRPTMGEHCDLCRERFERNVLRVLDCKSPRCREINAGAPKIHAFLSADNKEHFEEVGRLLKRLDRRVAVDPGIVRGLDYYTRTAFEIVSGALGAQNTVLGGGRYDGLVKDLGGPDLTGIGFALGLERLAMLVPAVAEEDRCQVFLMPLAPAAFDRALLVQRELRRAGVRALVDHERRGLKSQMKRADRLGARFAALLGEDELAREAWTVRDLVSSTQEAVPHARLVEYLGEKLHG